MKQDIHIFKYKKSSSCFTISWEEYLDNTASQNENMSLKALPNVFKTSAFGVTHIQMQIYLLLDSETHKVST